ncbi:hypothetical protein [Wolbachia endosymbiont (group A) of Agelastica alni]|uniref:hypothetical protein n=1 Tax=Wolbachia endosymbiont (group A) of Agelastica alni TaxID=3066130 RepID=UPI003340F978
MSVTARFFRLLCNKADPVSFQRVTLGHKTSLTSSASPLIMMLKVFSYLHLCRLNSKKTT